MPCDACLEHVPTPWLTPCLHALCAACAADLASFGVHACPRCHDSVAHADLVLESAAAPPRPADSDEAQPPLLIDWPVLQHQAQALSERAARFVADAVDLEQFALQNLCRVPADIAAAYAVPAMDTPACRAREAALRAEAALLLQADVKAAEAGVCDAQAFALACRDLLAACDAALALVEHGAMAANEDRAQTICLAQDLAADRLFARLTARQANLCARADAHLPALASAPYFACVRPLTPKTEPHAFVGRTLLWHERWAAPDHLQSRKRRDATSLRPVGVLPDGRPLVMLSMMDEGYAVPVPLETVACAGRSDAVLVPYMHCRVAMDAHVQADGAGRVWLSTAERLVAWAPDGRVLHDVSVAQLCRQLHVMVKWYHTRIVRVAVAPCGLVIVQLSDHGAICAATPDLQELVWLFCGITSDYLSFFMSVIGGDTLVVAFYNTNARLAIDVHTGKPRDAPEIARWDIDINHPWRLPSGAGRACALDHIWLPERLRNALPGLAPPPAAHGVARVCDLLVPQPNRCSVLGAHGLVYRGDLAGPLGTRSHTLHVD